MHKNGRTWKLKKKSFVKTEIDGVAWLLSNSHRSETKEEEVEESILSVMYSSTSHTNL
jgi:hypothetical protein